MDDVPDFERFAFDNAPVGLVLTEHRIIRACNQTFADMMEHPRDALVGQSFRVLYASASEFDRIRDIGLGPLRAQQDYSDERMMRTASGATIWCRFRAHSLTPEDPLARLVMSFAKISETQQVTLTPRERQVLGGIGRGLTSKEIARELSLSPRTIEDVRARLLRRFDVRNVAELLARLTHLEP